MNKLNYERELTDDQIFQSVFSFLNGKIDHQIYLEYDRFQQFLLGKGLIKEEESRGHIGPYQKKILLEGDYVRAQEIFMDFVFKGMLIPISSSTNLDTFTVVNSHTVVKSAKGNDFLSGKVPHTYSEFLESYQKLVGDDEFLIKQHEETLNEAVSFYRFVKKALEDRGDLLEEEVDFLSKRYFEKFFPHL